MYHVITFGKGAMGAYASQLRPEQRWWVIKYIRSKQGVGAPQAADSTGGGSNRAEAKPSGPGQSVGNPGGQKVTDTN
jgi:hypothetical protein